MRHRLMRAGRSATIPVSLALVLLLAGCASGESGAASGQPSTPAPEETMATDLPASPEPAGLECGERFRLRPGGVLTVTGRFPAAVPTGQQTVSGTVTVAAKQGAARGVVTPQAEAFLVRDGRLVTLPMAQDLVGRRLTLADGKPEPMSAQATLIPCAGGGELTTGAYDLYVRVVLNHDDGSRTDSIGGPWSLEVRERQDAQGG